MKLKMFLFRFLTMMLLTATLITGIAYAQENDPPLRNDQINEEPGAALESLDAGLSPAAPAAIDAVSGNAFSGGPAYDSGWVALAPDTAETLEHNLGGNPDDYIVDMQYWASGVDGINQRYYGGADFGTKITVQNPDDRVGAYWRSLNDTSISVYRRPEDVYAEKVRIRIWVDPFPDYDSGWIALPADGVDTLVHNLGGNPSDYVVDMLYRSPGSGINQRYFGGADFGANIDILTASPDDRVGAYWRSLNATAVTVFRR
ncbi:MAG TPA: hypothetical protein VLS48_05770, partial [Anaerolineales bacterium]|nr:hypothetical protein [Anaerolineales bacterium]